MSRLAHQYPDQPEMWHAPTGTGRRIPQQSRGAVMPPRWTPDVFCDALAELIDQHAGSWQWATFAEADTEPARRGVEGLVIETQGGTFHVTIDGPKSAG